MARSKNATTADGIASATTEGVIEPLAPDNSDGAVVPLPGGERTEEPATRDFLLGAASGAAPAPMPPLAACAQLAGLVVIHNGAQSRQVHPVDVADWMNLGWTTAASE
jgi:hypothetical protein